MSVTPIKPDAELTDEARLRLAETYEAQIVEAVRTRRFSTQLLAWARDPALIGTVPNEGLLAAVLVEICERLNANESMLLVKHNAFADHQSLPTDPPREHDDLT